MFSEKFNQKSLQKYIYVFELTENRKFLYSSFPKEESQLVLEATLYYDYLKRYKVLKIIDKREQHSGFDIDIYTKEYMYYYGIHYVRGGSYTEENLRKEQENFINDEFKTFDNDDIKPQEYFITIFLQEYRGRFTTKKDIDDEICRISIRRKQYSIEKERLDKYTSCSRWIYTFGDNINRLRLQCNNGGCYKRDDLNEYKKLIEKIKTLCVLLSENFPEILDRQDSGYLVYCKYPEFLFDNFIYRSGLGSLDSLDSVYRMCDLLIYFGDFLLNRICELEFDIASYGYEDEWIFSRRLYYLFNYSF